MSSPFSTRPTARIPRLRKGLLTLLPAAAALVALSGCAQTPGPALPPVLLPPGPPAPASYPIPAMHTRVYANTLANGLSVFVIPRPDLPLVSFRIGIRAGSSMDPAGRGGTAALTAGLLGRGTSSHDALALFRIIDASGGSLDASANKDLTVLSGDSLSTETPTLLELAAEMLLHPTFPETEFANRKNALMASLIESENHPGPIANIRFNRLVFGSGPYGHPPSGTAASVSPLTRDDLVTFARIHYRPDRAALILSGNITPEQGLALATRIFSGWTAPTAPSPAEPSRPEAPGYRVSSSTLLIDKPELSQATVFYGTRGVARSDPDYYNAMVFNMILGGTESSTLTHTIRQKMGLVYYIYSSLDAERMAGPFAVHFQTHAPNTKKVLDTMERLLDSAAVTPPDPEKVEAAKSKLIGGFPFLMNSTSKLASLVLGIWDFNLGFTYFTDYPEKVRALTPESVRRAGQALLAHKAFVTVIVGPRKVLGKAGIAAARPPSS